MSIVSIVSIVSGLEKGWKPKIEPTVNEEIEVNAVDAVDAVNAVGAVGAVDAMGGVTNVGKARKEGTTTTTISKNLQELDHQNRLKGDIVFKNVFFKYKGMQSNMLKQINFTIKEGALLNRCCSICHDRHCHRCYYCHYVYCCNERV